MKKDAFDRIAARTPKDSKIFVSKSLDVADRIDAIMKKQGKSQKDLAKLLNKTPSEISKWLSGSHNFTLKSIAKIEAVFDCVILETPKGKKEYVASKKVYTIGHATFRINPPKVLNYSYRKPKNENVRQYHKNSQRVNIN